MPQGHTNNRRGAPGKERAWATLIRKYGKETYYLADGTEKTAEQIIAELTINALITGRVDFPKLAGERRKVRTLHLRAEDWIRFLNKTREHIEGNLIHGDITSGGEVIHNPVTVYIPDNGRQDPYKLQSGEIQDGKLTE